MSNSQQTYNNDTLDLQELLKTLVAVKKGDFSARLPIDHTGMAGKVADTLNEIIEMNEKMAAELERISTVVGKEGQLAQRADVGNASGSWSACIDSVNHLISDLVQPTAETAKVIRAVANGDLSQTIATEIEGRPLKGEFLATATVVNTMVAQLSSFASEVTRVAREVGTEGKLGVQAEVTGVAGTWKDLTDSVNQMAGNLTAQVRNIAEVATAIALGDLSKKITVNVKGEILELKNTVNTMVDQLNSFASEVTRVAREVGTEGKLGVQAEVPGVAGTWKDLTDSVNLMAGNLTAQVRNIAEVTTAVAMGDLSKKVTADVKGEILELKNTVNTMVDQLNSFASEVTRVAREVGAEGKLGGQAEVRGVAGTWKDLTDSVNFMAGSLTAQVRNIAEVTTAVANGDLSKKITVDVKGEILELKNTINTMVDQLNSFAGEVTRVAREVGTEGKLGVQAEVRGVAGTWKDLTDSVNSMAGNLTAQVRNIAEVATAIASGDLSKKITVDVKGEIFELKNTINIMVDQLNSFASEVTRVAREVGAEGKLGGQAEVRGVAGTWKDLTDSVNFMAGSLTAQVRNIAEVTTAVANGDLSKKITVDVKGEILELKNTINTMVDQLNSFASEVTRVAREVGTEGKLGVQAEVRGVAGTWKDLTDSVNSMASSLTAQVRNIAEVTTAVANGDLSRKITVDVKGEILELKNTINTMVDQLNSFASEVTRVAREVGTEGKLGVQAYVKGVAGTWKDLTDNVNSMAGNLTAQVRNIAEVTKAVASGDLSKKITVDVKGEILELKNTINTMVDQLSSFASEVTRVAREVGTEGKLGGQAQVTGVAGIWKDLTDNVNSMAGNLTAQVRGIARVVTAVANGDLKRKLMLDAKGEIETLADTINEMIDTLATFADQVTTVAREVGIEGKLGGQAKVPGASGTWRHLTDNVNELAANLTTQVRAIAEVAIAVAKGDLTRSISVQAEGELAVLKDNINQMIANLRETTQKNTEQDWLKTNLAKFTRMLQGQRDLETVSKLILSELASLVGAQHGVFFLMDERDGRGTYLKLLSSYAYRERKNLSNRFYLGEGLVGQCALEKERILLTSVPEDYIKISSGLGDASPNNVVVLPVLFEGQVTAVIELASFQRFSEIHLTFFDQLSESIAIVLNTIAASMRTEELLKQSQSLAEELQTQQGELRETNQRLEQQAQSLKASEELLKKQQEQLQQTNEALEEKARLLSLQNEEVERKNAEIEQARRSLEEKAEQLALTSRYKSEFLANMSHELRTPLNSLLILAKLLADNIENNLTPKQVEYAATIYSSGSDLLGLINDILDLAKIESGTMSIEVEQMQLEDLRHQIERSFRQIAHDKGLEFSIIFDPRLPSSIYTDSKRLQQVLKNLLSNAFKFTAKGQVSLSLEPAIRGWSLDNEILNSAELVLAFAVTDTGIGIAPEKQKLIFEAFQQADGTTSRQYGGTGLGLSISREIARLLGGEITVISRLGYGSTFTLYLPQTYLGISHTLPSNNLAKNQEQENISQTPLIAPSLNPLLKQPVNPNPPITVETVATTVTVPQIDPQTRDGNGGTQYREHLVFTEEPLINAPSVGLAWSDDRSNIAPGDRTIVILEDDINFARLLLEVVREQGFKGLIAMRCSSGLAMIQKHHPCAVILDICLPGDSGWTVLDRIKHDPYSRHIPAIIMSVKDERYRGQKLGAYRYYQKPMIKEKLTQIIVDLKQFIERTVKNLFLVSNDEGLLTDLRDIIGSSDVRIDTANTIAAGIERISNTQDKIDCVVLDAKLPAMDNLAVFEEQLQSLKNRELPIVIYAQNNQLNEPQKLAIERLSHTLHIKVADSQMSLFYETALLLHRKQSDLPEQGQVILKQLHNTIGNILADKKVLVVDDDVRNIFALTSLLERHRMQVIPAENGAAGIAYLQNTPDIDLVLMDVMMPGMDGYETMKTIRKIPQFHSLPIIALTAKAMKGDRDKCLDAGASDYITKPVDTEQLLSILRVWLS
ncbi:HAMP domain-containing protein [Gloeothece verrucosa]|uniref:Circadian input-output histidine kinase CikA n=1 Tax=Gloeothece verrucosa (strain PCC 7822) TaxID=497965 RepID=E0U8V2_GLOV7|nr:HAMP domain-containing protein [Gloeothece verrucosa]ADN14966.1 GAF sensor hybrid histidine kinase [Gloeothece verrucosa PCC 7822]